MMKPQTKLRMKCIRVMRENPQDIYQPVEFKRFVPKTIDAERRSAALNNCFSSMSSSGWIRKVGRGQYKITATGRKVELAA